MAGVSVSEGGKGGKKSVNFNLNLVPMIDLLSCCVAFLLITAVWVQMARINIAQRGPSRPNVDEPPPEQKQLKLIVYIEEDRYLISQGYFGGTTESTDIPKVGEKYDYIKLGEHLRKIKKLHQEKKDIVVASRDPIIYDAIISTVDICLEENFPEISIAEASMNL